MNNRACRYYMKFLYNAPNVRAHDRFVYQSFRVSTTLLEALASNPSVSSLPIHLVKIFIYQDSVNVSCLFFLHVFLQFYAFQNSDRIQDHSSV